MRPMSPWRAVVAFLSRLRDLCARRRLAREAEQEIEMHLDLLAARFARAGNAPAEARRLARAKFGGVAQIREELRDQAGFPMLESWVRDVRHAARGLLRDPSFSLVVILTLGVGVGANAAVFSFVNAVLLQPLPYVEADRLAAVQETNPPAPFLVTPGDYVDWRERNEVFETLSGYLYSVSGLTTPAGDAELLYTVAVSADFFRTLRVRPLLGRTFLPGEDRPGRDGVAVIGHGLWTLRFGGEPDIVGREIALDGRPFTVVGVMPAEFEFPPGGRDVWLPLVLTEADRNDRRNHGVVTVGRLRPGVTLERARAAMAALGDRLAAAHPRTNTGRGVEVVELRHQQRGVTGPFLLLGQIAAVLVLLVACANVSNLQLGRMTSRAREMTVRAALGAGRWRIGRLVAVESLLLALVAGGIGVGVAAWGVGVLKDSISPEMARWIQGFRDIGVDWPVLAFSLAMAAVAGVAFGVAAASAAWRPAVMDALREGAPTGTARRAALRRALVAAEVALAVVITVSAGQAVQGFRALHAGSRGFSPQGVGTMLIRPPDARVEDSRRVIEFYDDVLARASAVPGVESAGLASQLPASLRHGPTVELRIEGRPESAPGETPLTDVLVASGGYFRTAGIPLLDGRTFDARDEAGEDGAFAVVIGEGLARRYWPDGNTLGQRLQVPAIADGGAWASVVGVVGDVRQNWFEAERPFLYLSAGQVANRQMYLTVRGRGTVERLLSDTALALRRMDPALPIFEGRPLSVAVDTGVAGVREVAAVMGVFGVLALLLSAIGVYGVMAYSVGQRERELGIRMALGAAPRAVLGAVVRQGLGTAAVGLCIGVLAAMATTRLFAGLLFGTSADSAAVTALVTALVFAAVLVACWLPARLAVRVDPVRALRAD